MNYVRKTTTLQGLHGASYGTILKNVTNIKKVILEGSAVEDINARVGAAST